MKLNTTFLEFLSSVKTSVNGDHLLVGVSKRVRLPSSYQPKDLEVIDSKVAVARNGVKLRTEAAKAFIDMFKTGKNQGVNLIVLSAYRSYKDQEKVFADWAVKYGSRVTRMFSALPGHSEHQLGTALDLTSPQIMQGESNNFADTLESKWLKRNAAKFGFVLSYPEGKEKVTGYIYEPWHYRYIGVKNAEMMNKLRLTLEEFIKLIDEK